MNLSQIVEGWRNKVLPPEDLKQFIEDTYNERFKVCKSCPLFSENKKKTGWSSLRIDEHCTDCGCTISAKARCLSCKCPQNKWEAITTEEKYEEIKQAINGK